MKRFVILMICVFVCIYSNVQAKTLVIALEGGWPPYCIQDKVTGQYSGYAVDLVRNILNEMDVDFKFKSFPWKRIEFKIMNGIIDGAFPASYVKERTVKCSYPSTILFTARYFFYINRKNRDILKFNNLNNLKQYKIGMTNGYGYNNQFMNFMKNNNKYNITANSNDLNFKKLVYERIEYFPAEERGAFFILKKLGYTNDIIKLPKLFFKKSYYIMFNKENVSKKFIQNFSVNLNKYKKTKKFKKVYDQYFKY